MLEEPFLVVRAAGSLGVDLVALRWDFSFPIEVKSTVDGILHFSRNPRLTEQALQMSQECEIASCTLIRLQAQRGEGRSVEVFTLPDDDVLRGRCGLLKRHIPKMEVSNNGNYIMKWENGMKLSDLLSYMGMSDFESD